MKNKQKIIALTILLGIFFVPLVSATSYSDQKNDVWNIAGEGFGTGVIDIESIVVSNDGIQINFYESISPQLGNTTTGIFVFLQLYNATHSLNFILAFAYIEETFTTMEGMGMIVEKTDNSTDGGEVDAILFDRFVIVPFPMSYFTYDSIEVLVTLAAVDVSEEMDIEMTELDWYPNITPAELGIFDVFELFEMNDASEIEAFLEVLQDIPIYEETSVLTELLESENLWIYVILAVLLLTTLSLAVMLAKKPKQLTPQELKYKEKEMKRNEKTNRN